MANRNLVSQGSDLSRKLKDQSQKLLMQKPKAEGSLFQDLPALDFQLLLY
jgi:hypothetical protein